MSEVQATANVPMIEERQKTKKTIRIGHKKTKQQSQIFLVVTIALFFLALTRIQLDFSYVQSGAGKTMGLLSQLLQPDFSVLGSYLVGLAQTLAIAFLGLGFSVILSFFLVFLVAENTAINKVLANVIKAIMTFIRAIPITIWVLIAAASVGFGSLAGVLGLLFPTTAYLVRILSGRVEESGADTIEALRACGATWLQIVFKGVFVELFPQFLTTIAMRYELSVSEAVVLGMVGVAGIGYRLNMSIGTYQFQVAATGILVVYIAMLTLELVSKKVVTIIKREGR